MAVTVRRNTDMTQAFRLGGDDIGKLIDILSALGDRFSCTIHCADGLTREFATVKDLLDYENPPSKTIRALTINMRSADYKGYVELSFRNKLRDNITVRLNGPEDLISKISNNLDDFFPRIKTWYGFIAMRDYPFILWNLLLFLIGAISVLSMVGLIPKGDGTGFDKSTTAEKVNALLLFCSIPGGLFVFGYAFNRIRDWIFPQAEFAIGQGVQRDAHRERLRRSLMSIIVVPSILSGLGLLIWKLIG